MAVSDKTRILIWSRAGYRCAMCQRELFVDEVTTDDPSLVGDIAHIVAEKEKGARGNSPLTPEQRDLFSNLVLLCKEHHKIVDDNEAKYTVEALTEIKQKHEKTVSGALSKPDKAKQRSIELYADYLEHWENSAEIEHWGGWTSYMLGSGQPRMRREIAAQLEELRAWLFNRIWPDHFPEIRHAMENFLLVLSDLMREFNEHSEETGDLLSTRKFYRNAEPGTNAERRALRQYEFHVALVQDLTLELTRAANFICDAFRHSLDTSYRLKEGVLTVESGPYMDLSWKRHRVAYHGDQRTATPFPYPGLDIFKVVRKDRDYHWGEGTSIDDPNCRIGGDE
ncbi:MAG: HNH endonuclease [Phycisphaerales bacterium]